MIVLALGADTASIEGSPPETVRRAICALEGEGLVIAARSRVVIADQSSEGVQPWYATMAALIDACPPALELSSMLRRIERRFGSDAPIDGAGPLRIAIVGEDGTVDCRDDAGLPDRPIAACAFLLAPLAEIAAEWREAGSGSTIEALLSAADRHGLMILRPVPRLMGIVNATPDSFSDGGRFAAADAAVARAVQLIDEGADIIDIGGESTRPGAAPVSPEEEQARVLPVIRGLAPLAKRRNRLISIDTRHASTMAAAVAAGAGMINDVSALADADAGRVAAECGVPVVLMHMRGDPATMQLDPRYDDVVGEVVAALRMARDRAVAAGIPEDRIWLDPGIGFGKRPRHNLALLSATERIRALGHPVLIGVSRKNVVGRIERDKRPEERVSESIAAALGVAARGADALRIHDVAATRQALAIWSGIEAVQIS